MINKINVATIKSGVHLSLFFLIFLLVWTFPLAQENLGKGRINGTVIDENGRPVEGAIITVESLTSKTKLEGKSDKKGHFAVAGMGTGMWRITASKPGYVSSSTDMYVRQLATNPPITFTLKKITGLAALTTDETSMKLFDDGNKLIEAGQYDEALKVFEEFLAKYPQIHQVHLNIGTCYLKKDDLDKAEAAFKLVLDKTIEVYGDYKKDPAASLRAFAGLGEIYLKRNDLETARKYFTQALDVSPEDEVAAYNVAEILFSHQNIDEAIRYYELAIKIKKDWSKPYHKLGLAYLNKGDFEKALENLRKFLEIDPNNPEAPTVKNIIEAVEKIKK
ncbi:MAG: tetratricopeptide repeat protein [Candidatus Aminicenantes bacterium]|nr:tetratricopeptide repeat protein [Candidatus Aminicenantes bacterium]